MSSNKFTFTNSQIQKLLKAGCRQAFASATIFEWNNGANDKERFIIKYIVRNKPTDQNKLNCFIVNTSTPKFDQVTTYYKFNDMLESINKT